MKSLINKLNKVVKEQKVEGSTKDAYQLVLEHLSSLERRKKTPSEMFGEFSKVDPEKMSNNIIEFDNCYFEYKDNKLHLNIEIPVKKIIIDKFTESEGFVWANINSPKEDFEYVSHNQHKLSGFKREFLKKGIKLKIDKYFDSGYLYQEEDQIVIFYSFIILDVFYDYPKSLDNILKTVEEFIKLKDYSRFLKLVR